MWPPGSCIDSPPAIDWNYRLARAANGEAGRGRVPRSVPTNGSAPPVSPANGRPALVSSTNGRAAVVRPANRRPAGQQTCRTCGGNSLGSVLQVRWRVDTSTWKRMQHSYTERLFCGNISQLPKQFGTVRLDWSRIIELEHNNIDNQQFNAGWPSWNSSVNWKAAYFLCNFVKTSDTK